MQLTTDDMSGKCQDRHHPQQQHQQRSRRFKSVVRRVLFALSLHVGHRRAEPPSSLPVAEGADDCFECVEACGDLIMTSTSTVTTTVCRLAAVEEEQRSRSNSLVSNSVTALTAFQAIRSIHDTNDRIKSSCNRNNNDNNNNAVFIPTRKVVTLVNLYYVR